MCQIRKKRRTLDFPAIIQDAFVGILILVISPHPSKKVVNFSCVVLKDTFPTHTEFVVLREQEQQRRSHPSNFVFLAREASSFPLASFLLLTTSFSVREDGLAWYLLWEQLPHQRRLNLHHQRPSQKFLQLYVSF